MEWSLAFDWRALGDPASEGRRVWEWIQQVRPLHPSLDLWRPTAESPQEAVGCWVFFGQCLFVFQAALVRSRNSCSISLGVRYPRAE